MMEESPTESRPLLNSDAQEYGREKTSRKAMYDFLEGKTTLGDNDVPTEGIEMKPIAKIKRV